MAQSQKVKHANSTEASTAMANLKGLFKHLYNAQNELEFNIKSLQNLKKMPHFEKFSRTLFEPTETSVEAQVK